MPVAAYVDETNLVLGCVQQLSQFWYDDTTAAVLAQEAIAVAKDSGRQVKQYQRMTKTILRYCRFTIS